MKSAQSAGSRIRCSVFAAVCTGMLGVVTGAPAASDVLDRPWCRLSTPGFESISDLDGEKSRALLTSLEQFDAAARVVLGQPRRASAAPLKVLVFAGRRDFERVFNTPGFAGFMNSSIHDNVLTVGPDAAGEHLIENLLHEYTHHVLRDDPGGALPLWYEEGLASFLATMRLDGSGTVILGHKTKHQPERLHGVGDWKDTNIRYLEAPTSLRSRGSDILRDLVRRDSMRGERGERVQDFYQRSWLLVHLLHLGHAAGYTDRRSFIQPYVDAVRGGDDAFEALVEVTGESPVELARDLSRYAERRKFPTATRFLQLSRPAHVKNQDCLDQGQIAYELGIASTAINPGFARDAFDWLIEKSADDPRAYIGHSILERGRGEFLEASRAARFAVHLDARSARARVELATAMIEACRDAGDTACHQQWREAATIYEAALAMEPERADAAFGLGVALFLLAEPMQAIRMLQRAHEHAPWAPRISLFLGDAWRQVGDIAKARWHLARAVRWEVEPAWQAQARRAYALVAAAEDGPAG